MKELALFVISLSAFNAYLLLSLSKDHFLFFIGKRIPLKCEPCRAFWLSLAQSVALSLYIGQTTDFAYLFLPFLLAGLTNIFYKFIQ